MEERKYHPASQETIDNLTENMLLSMGSLYQEMYVDRKLMERLIQKSTNYGEKLNRDYINKVINIHFNVCYALFSICVQCRASLKSLTNVEKVYNIRRSVVTSHEIYKYLFGFNNKKTFWKEIEQTLQIKYPETCSEIASSTNDFYLHYVKESDRTLRNVAKHFSDNPLEFFTNMSQVDEHRVTERIAKALGFLQPIHLLLVNELLSSLGIVYALDWTNLLPINKLGNVNQNSKTEELLNELKKFSGIVDRIMKQLDLVEILSEKFKIDFSKSKLFTEFTEHNMGLHILYIYIDSLSTFLAFSRSENYVEYKQNLAYLIVSAHEGFKKLYGFDDNKRENSYWNRGIKIILPEISDDQIKAEVENLEGRLNELSHNDFLKDEDIVISFTHFCNSKNTLTKSSFAILEGFEKDVKKDDMDVLTKYLFVLNDLMLLYDKIIDLKNRQLKIENEDRFAKTIELIDKNNDLAEQNIKDKAALAQWRENSNKMIEVLKSFEQILT